jgi:hypothetical protein
MKNAIVGMLIVLGSIVSARVASAQQKVPSYQSAKPTLSPYLYLTRPQIGFFPNYQTFVQPTYQQTRTNQIQQTQITNLNQQTEQLQKEQKSLQNKPAAVAPTGHASIYGSTSHYYSTGSSSGGGRQGGPKR